jgi:hypothetical protein
VQAHKDVVARAAAGALARPEFDAGDALIFDERLLHRTDLPAGLSETRYALECWLFARPILLPHTSRSSPETTHTNLPFHANV